MLNQNNNVYPTLFSFLPDAGHKLYFWTLLKTYQLCLFIMSFTTAAPELAQFLSHGMTHA